MHLSTNIKLDIFWYSEEKYWCIPFDYITADNIALGRNVTGLHYNPYYTTYDTTTLTDGSNATCESFKGQTISFQIDLGKTYSIKSSMLTLKGKSIYLQFMLESNKKIYILLIPDNYVYMSESLMWPTVIGLHLLYVVRYQLNILPFSW